MNAITALLVAVVIAVAGLFIVEMSIDPYIVHVMPEKSANIHNTLVLIIGAFSGMLASKILAK